MCRPAPAITNAMPGHGEQSMLNACSSSARRKWPVEIRHTCKSCGSALTGRPHAKFCGKNCRNAYYRKHPPEKPGVHECRICKTEFPITKEQGNKWLCSDECRKKSVAASVGAFHRKNPHREAEYRTRTKARKGPDSNLIRFYKWNPGAPRKCESCGEHRVLEIAHKPHYARVGRHRAKDNSQWPEMVWVLCPTCHQLIDRMNYPPSELGLVE